jgi:hypothetical protein
MTPLQQFGYFVLLAVNQPERFTGRIRLEFNFAHGILKESTVIGMERRIDLNRLNESADNKTLDKTESISYLSSA